MSWWLSSAHSATRDCCCCGCPCITHGKTSQHLTTVRHLTQFTQYITSGKALQLYIANTSMLVSDIPSRPYLWLSRNWNLWRRYLENKCGQHVSGTARRRWIVGSTRQSLWPSVYKSANKLYNVLHLTTEWSRCDIFIINYASLKWHIYY